MTDNITIGFDLGALAPPIGEQIPQLPQKAATRIERFRVAINLLRIHQILTQAEARNAEKRLVKEITDELRGPRA